MEEYTPSFHITEKIITLVGGISEQIGQLTAQQKGTGSPYLRRENRIHAIHSSLAIEYNSLSLDQVTAIPDGKHVPGNPNEIRVVKNAFDAYALMSGLDPSSIDDLLCAHSVMMKDPVQENGRFRSRGIGIFVGDKVIHIWPQILLLNV